MGRLTDAAGSHSTESTKPVRGAAPVPDTASTTTKYDVFANALKVSACGSACTVSGVTATQLPAVQLPWKTPNYGVPPRCGSTLTVTGPLLTGVYTYATSGPTNWPVGTHAGLW